MNSVAGWMFVKVWRVMVPVYIVVAKASKRTPPKAKNGSTLSSRKRWRAGMLAEAVWLRVGGMLCVFVCVMIVRGQSFAIPSGEYRMHLEWSER